MNRKNFSIFTVIPTGFLVSLILFRLFIQESGRLTSLSEYNDLPLWETFEGLYRSYLHLTFHHFIGNFLSLVAVTIFLYLVLKEKYVAGLFIGGIISSVFYIDGLSTGNSVGASIILSFLSASVVVVYMQALIQIHSTHTISDILSDTILGVFTFVCYCIILWAGNGIVIDAIYLQFNNIPTDLLTLPEIYTYKTAKAHIFGYITGGLTMLFAIIYNKRFNSIPF